MHCQLCGQPTNYIQRAHISPTYLISDWLEDNIDDPWGFWILHHSKNTTKSSGYLILLIFPSYSEYRASSRRWRWSRAEAAHRRSHHVIGKGSQHRRMTCSESAILCFYASNPIATVNATKASISSTPTTAFSVSQQQATVLLHTSI